MSSEHAVPGSPRIAEGPVVLRPFALADVPQLAAWTPDARCLMQWAGPTLSHPLAPEQFGDLFEQDPSRPHTMAWQICDRDGAKSLGHVELTRIDRVGGSAHVTRVLVGSPPVRGRGIGGAAIRAVSRVATERLGLRELSLVVFTWNTQAIACYEREGFQREERPRPAVEVDGQSWESVWMAWRAAGEPRA